ncbi:MAG: hypothetical protein OEV17_00560, partial [Nitrospira sp.]|nr:hypothetical protein [Nitrospira sp.]
MLVPHHPVQLPHIVTLVLAGGSPLVEVLTCFGKALFYRPIIDKIARRGGDSPWGTARCAVHAATDLAASGCGEGLDRGEETCLIEPVPLLVMGELVGTVVMIMYLRAFTWRARSRRSSPHRLCGLCVLSRGIQRSPVRVIENSPPPVDRRRRFLHAYEPRAVEASRPCLV